MANDDFSTLTHDQRLGLHLSHLKTEDWSIVIGFTTEDLKNQPVHRNAITCLQIFAPRQLILIPNPPDNKACSQCVYAVLLTLEFHIYMYITDGITSSHGIGDMACFLSMIIQFWAERSTRYMHGSHIILQLPFVGKVH